MKDGEIMSDFANTVDVLGDDALADLIVSRNITELRDDAIKTLGNNSFRECNKLAYVDLASATEIKGFSFYKCSALTTLIIRTGSVCVSPSIPCSSTPIASGTGYIYVPRDLVDSYKAATNWSTYANQFRALEDYTVDGTITGELDPTKI